MQLKTLIGKYFNGLTNMDVRGQVIPVPVVHCMGIYRCYSGRDLTIVIGMTILVLLQLNMVIYIFYSGLVPMTVHGTNGHAAMQRKQVIWTY
jgi:hypothetical protein